MLPKPLNQTVSQQEIDQGEARKRQRGTGFTNIGRILGANIGAGQKMGESIGTQLGQQAEQVRKGIEAGQSQFKAGMQESAKKEQEKLGKAETALTGIKEMQPQTQPVDYEAIGMGLRGAEYTGPKGIQNIQEQQQRAMNLAALGRLSGMAGGQQELLRSQVAGRGRYGLGQSALDAMLLGREGQRQLEAARSATGALASEAQQTQTMAQEQARAMESSIEANKLAALEKIQKEAESSIQTGTEQAKAHYRTAEIAKNALKKVYEAKDPNQIELNADELDALSKAKDLGIDLSYKIDPRNKKLTDQILQQIAKSGQSVYSGGLMMDEAQREKLKNLDLLLGSKQKRENIEKDVFGDVSKEAENLLQTEYENKLKFDALKNIYDEKLFKQAAIAQGGKSDYFSTPENVKNFWRKYQELITRPQGYTPVTESGKHGLRTFNAYIDALRAKESEYQKSNIQTVQDYLNKIIKK